MPSLQSHRTAERRTDVHYTYMLRCADGSLYTGWTTDLSRRVRTHNSGKGAKYTRSRRPVRLVYYECFDKKEDALARERAIKKLDHAAKEAMVRENGRGICDE